jgi:hypothetical protein
MSQHAQLSGTYPYDINEQMAFPKGAGQINKVKLTNDKQTNFLNKCSIQQSSFQQSFLQQKLFLQNCSQLRAKCYL